MLSSPRSAEKIIRSIDIAQVGQFEQKRKKEKKRKRKAHQAPLGCKCQSLAALWAFRETTNHICPYNYNDAVMI